MLFGFGFSPSKPRKAGGVANDPDAEAFFTATGITDATQKSAVNQLVLDLKSYNIWTKMKAVYPMVGGTSTTHKFNLVNPADTNAAFRLTFSTGWTHSSTGAKPNGSSAFANTNFTPSTNGMQLNSAHISFYSRTDSNTYMVEMGNWDTTTSTLLLLRDSNTLTLRMNNTTNITFSNTNSTGFYKSNRTASNVLTGWKNGVKSVTSSVASTSLPTNVIYIGAFRDGSLTAYYSSKECAFASIGDGLTDTEAANFNTAVNNFQTTLGRNV